MYHLFDIERLIKINNNFAGYLKFNKNIIKIKNLINSIFENMIHSIKKKF